ncbi:MAG: hypothetical protein AB7O88_05150 [Reyranellaceae bacterium]
MRVALALAIALTALRPPVALALTEMECADLFRKADVNNDEVLAGAEATRYLAAMRIWPVALPEDGKITYAAFVEHCRNGIFREAVNDPDAPLKGANSFTEAQARDRAEARGFVAVSGLKKDDAGIWRGTARMDGKEFAVAIDYKGNVVSKPR